MRLTSSRNLSPSLGLATAAYFENFPLKDAAFAFAAARITCVTTAGSLSFSFISSKYFLLPRQMPQRFLAVLKETAIASVLK